MGRTRVGVYGGTFDPVHNGHIKVAHALISAFDFERLLFVPAFVPPHKRGREISSAYHRVAMLALATVDEQQILVSTIELETPTRPYTVETLARLESLEERSQLFFVMGADSFLDIASWREHETLLSSYSIVVAMRPGYDEHDPASHLNEEIRARVVDLRGRKSPQKDVLNAPHVFLTDYVAADISATRVRELMAAGGDTTDYVPASVAKYAAKHKLYDDQA